MLILHGVYHFGRRKVGVRKEFCDTCQRECLAELWRSFDCHHILFVPILPLGAHERWLCALCNQDPRKRPRTRKGFKIAGLVALAVLLVSLFTMEAQPGEAGFTWGVRVAVALGFLALLYSIIKRPPAVSDEDCRKAVVPLSSETCAFCKGPLASQPNLHCPTCQIRIYTEERPMPAAVYRPIVERIKSKTGGDFRPASELSLAALRKLRLPEPVVAFYGQYEPATIIENEQTVRLLPVSAIVEGNTKGSVGLYTSPHGYIEFASTFSGDAYCFDVNSLNGAGEPRIVILSHESVCDESTPEEIAKLAKPVAQDLREFLEQYLSGELDQEALDYGAAGL